MNILWWLHPACVAGALLASVTCLTYLTPESSFRALWEVPKCFYMDDLLRCLLLTGALVFGSCVGSWLPPLAAKPVDWRDAVPWNLVRMLFQVGLVLCLAGYAIWFAIGVTRGVTPAALLAVLKAEGTGMYEIREYFGKAPGLTTMTQFGMGVVVLGIMLGAAQGWRHIRWKIALLLLLTTVRALFLSERLALLELLIPCGILYLNLRHIRLGERRDRMGPLLFLVPLAAPLFVYLFFMAFEYFRSWAAYYAAASNLSLAEFALLRLAGYYITAINNGALLVQDLESPLPLPYFSLEWLWKFPVLKDFLDYEKLSQVPIISMEVKLVATSANPEFNNPCGLILPQLDFGFPGALVFYLWLGLIMGGLYRLFRQGHVLGLAYYPIFFVGILELPRVLYWPSSRVFPTWILLLPIFVAGLRSLWPATVRPDLKFETRNPKPETTSRPAPG
ncbi:MAG: oligosaccharide repeat unit polymerase [Verrucomicrobia bacterium]|nr:oligosaccharide repeat unit polymerase [Verrucomicrobiota bacterium]